MDFTALIYVFARPCFFRVLDVWEYCDTLYYIVSLYTILRCRTLAHAVLQWSGICQRHDIVEGWSFGAAKDEAVMIKSVCLSASLFIPSDGRRLEDETA